MANEERLKSLMSRLANEAGDSKGFRSTIEAIFTIHRNIQRYSGEEKYCTLKLSNEKVQKFWQFQAIQMILFELGWIKEENKIVFRKHENLNFALKFLENYRLIAPSEAEWVDETKIEDLNVKERQENEKRALAAKERDKELTAFYKDQQERKELALNIKKQIEADRMYRQSNPIVVRSSKSISKTASAKQAGNAAVARNLSEPTLSIEGRAIRRK